MRPQHAQRGEAAVIQWLVLEERDIEFIRNEGRGNVMSQTWMTVDRGKVPRPPAFIRDSIRFSDAQSERRIVVEEEGRDVVIKDQEKNIRFLLSEPVTNGLIALKNGCPDRIVFLFLVKRKADSRGMRRGDSANNFCHAQYFIAFSWVKV